MRRIIQVRSIIGSAGRVVEVPGNGAGDEATGSILIGVYIAFRRRLNGEIHVGQERASSRAAPGAILKDGNAVGAESAAIDIGDLYLVQADGGGGVLGRIRPYGIPVLKPLVVISGVGIDGVQAGEWRHVAENIRVGGRDGNVGPGVGHNAKGGIGSAAVGVGGDQAVGAGSQAGRWRRRQQVAVRIQPFVAAERRGGLHRSGFIGAQGGRVLHHRLRQGMHLEVDTCRLPAALYGDSYRPVVVPEDIDGSLVFLSGDRARSGGVDRPAVIQAGEGIGREGGNAFVTGI